MWTKNFETLVNATAFVNKWLNIPSPSSGSNIYIENGYHEETPFSIKDTDGIIQNTYIGGNYLDSKFISNAKYTVTNNIYTIDGAVLKSWGVKGLLSDGEIGAHGYMNVCFGGGTAPESRDDYTIDSIGGIKTVGTVQVGAILNEQNNNYDLIISSVIQCPNACTINEIGIHRVVHKYSDSYSVSTTDGRWCNVLLYRKVLDTPIVLQPNQPANVTFQISLPRITLA